jgi:hypothetical protein
LAAVVGFSTYAQTFGFGFIYDDYWTVVNNAHLDKPVGQLLRAAISGRSIEWGMPDATRPLMGLSLHLDRWLFGLSPMGYHVHSVCLYAAVCVAVFSLAFAVLRRFSSALAAGLLFAVSPLHAEVVAAVSYREDLLSALGLFGAAALVFWPSARPAPWRAYACAGLWLYALLGKESGLIGPLLVAALALIRRPSRGVLAARPPVWLLGAAVALVWCNWRFGVSVLGEQIPLAEYGSWSEKLLRTARFELWSGLHSLVPIWARPEHEALPEPHWGWLLACVALVPLALALLRRRALRVLSGALGVALLSPFLTSPIFGPVNETADRYWFVGSLSGALLVGAGVSALGRRYPALGLSALVLLVAVGMLGSRAAGAVWGSEVSLWTAAVEAAPRSGRAWTSMSRVHRMAEQEQLAERAVQRALELRPDYLPGQVARVLNQLWAGKLEEARAGLVLINAQTRLQRDAVRVAARCAARESAAEASACARRSVPAGLVLGDPERARVTTERLLGLDAKP